MASTAPSLRDTELLPEAELQFDARNPRFASEDEAEASQVELLEILWRDFAVDEVALSIAANGFFQYEPLFVSREEGRLIVIEGNRRLAAVRLLLYADLRQRVGATDLPRITARAANGLHELPAVIGPRNDVWQYIGFKHVNGPQAWRSHSKAQYIAWVHNELKVPLQDIAQQIGDRHRTVRRFYRALMALEQAADADVFHVEDRVPKQFAFSHLYTALDYKGFQTFLGIDAEKSFRPNPVPKRHIRELAQVCIWLYGSKSRGQAPVIKSQNPDLRRLDEVLQSRDGVAALSRGLGLSVSLDISRGDEQLFRQAMLDARQSLQEARGKLLTGYDGELDLLRVSEEIVELADNVSTEMRARRASRRRSRRSSRTSQR